MQGLQESYRLLREMVVQLHINQQQAKKQMKFLSKPQANGLISVFREALEQKNLEYIAESIVVLKKLAGCYTYEELGWHQTKQVYDHFSEYITGLDCNQMLEDSVELIEILYLMKGDNAIIQSEALFKVLLMKISLVKGQIMEVLIEVLVEILKENKKLIAFANTPYFFLEYWLHMINQETQSDRKCYWVSCVKNLYEHPGAGKNLFYASDFRTFVDILFSIIQNAKEANTIRACLECYLVLSCTDNIMVNGKHYRLRDLQDKLRENDIEELGIKMQGEEILSMGSDQ